MDQHLVATYAENNSQSTMCMHIIWDLMKAYDQKWALM